MFLRIGFLFPLLVLALNSGFCLAYYEDDYADLGICTIHLEGTEPPKDIKLQGTMDEGACRKAASVQLFMNSSHYDKVSHTFKIPEEE